LHFKFDQSLNDETANFYGPFNLLLSAMPVDQKAAFQLTTIQVSIVRKLYVQISAENKGWVLIH
jgi:hypothetical protein